MKKYIKNILIIVFILLLIGLVYCNLMKDSNKENDNIQKEAIYFSKLYDVDKNNVFRKISAKNAVDLIKNKTGIIYLGYPDCPWCQDLVPILNEVAIEDDLKVIYYIDNFYNMRPDKNDNPTNTNEYNELVNLLGENIVELKKDENTFDIIRVPLILFIKDGEIVDYHKGTYEGHELKEKIEENGKKRYYLEDLTNEQKKDIKNILDTKIRKVYSNKCDSSC